MPEIASSTRRVLKATYVPLLIETSGTTLAGRAVQKFGYVRQLELQPGEVAAAARSLSSSGSPVNGTLIAMLSKFEGTPLPSQLPPISALATTPTQDLIAFGTALTTLRQDRMNQLPAPTRETVVSVATDPRTLALHLLNVGHIATNTFSQTTDTSLVGMLNLERLEMTPAGIERGELLATIPLAPLEQTAVVQKEWSVTTKEFTSIVTDSLENYSETGVTENNELAQSTTAQTQHSSQFNVNATVSGSIGFVTATVASGFSTQDQSSKSAVDSTKHAVATTKKASTRVKQEHKVTISTTTVTGASESTTRILQNPSATDPMRIDYFSLMRKWHVALFRYGLRLTYDIVIPEPGGTLREAYMQLANLQSQAAQGFIFPLTYSDITVQSYWDLSSKLWFYASEWGAQVPPPPGPDRPLNVGGPVPGLDQGEDWHFFHIPFSVDPGFWITDVFIHAMVGTGQTQDSNPKAPSHNFNVIGSGYGRWDNVHQYDDDLTTPQYNNFMLHYTGDQSIDCFFQWANVADVRFTIQTEPTPQTVQGWVSSVWNALYNAAQTVFYAQQQAINSQIQVLQDRINNVDTLTLRREENDEITKGVLRWLLGPGFDFMPPGVAQLFNGPDVAWGIGYSPSAPNELGLSQTAWSTVTTYEQMVRFVNDAIDWDNILYFLYSYFWDIPLAWDNIRNIQHPDSTRQAFLRAGSARVVLTVRKGWEKAWVEFAEGGTFGQGPLPSLHPYLTIAQEIQDYDDTNYPGIPAANPGSPLPPDDGVYVASSSSDTPVASSNPVKLTVVSSTGFIAGYNAIIDSYESGVQETCPIVAVPDATHITIKALNKAHDGSINPFPVIQAGEKGQLIAEWFEYTPSSGTDIAVTSDLTTIA
jgi:hypothetical protein